MAGPVGVGVIGSGFMGSTWSRVTASQVKEARLVAIGGGRGAPALAAELSIEQLDLAAQLARDDIELLILATPPKAHLEQVRAAAAAGKHVLVEKPFANSVAEADEMVAIADAAGIRLGVVSQHRFRAAPVAARKLIDEGRIGDIRMIRVFGPGVGWDIPLDSWNSNAANVTPYFDWGAHACDIVRWLTGSEPALAFGQYASYGNPGPEGQSAMASYTMANGVLVQIWLTYELPEGTPGLGSAMQLLITGSKGVIDLDSYGTVKLQTADGWQTAFEQPPFDPLDLNSQVRFVAYANELRDVIAAIHEGRDPFVSGRQGALTTRMLEAAERSARTGESVRVG
ncbi:MAG: Gfo/Idh/MocA family oxidoreductase [Chloroflexota bacterium]